MEIIISLKTSSVNNSKKAAVHPTHKQNFKTIKSNYGPSNILLNLSKIY